MNNDTFLALPNITSPHVTGKSEKKRGFSRRTWHAGKRTGMGMGMGDEPKGRGRRRSENTPMRLQGEPSSLREQAMGHGNGFRGEGRNERSPRADSNTSLPSTVANQRGPPAQASLRSKRPTGQAKAKEKELHMPAGQVQVRICNYNATSL